MNAVYITYLKQVGSHEVVQQVTRHIEGRSGKVIKGPEVLWDAAVDASYGGIGPLQAADRDCGYRVADRYVFEHAGAGHPKSQRTKEVLPESIMPTEHATYKTGV